MSLWSSSWTLTFSTMCMPNKDWISSFCCLQRLHYSEHHRIASIGLHPSILPSANIRSMMVYWYAERWLPIYILIQIHHETAELKKSIPWFRIIHFIISNIYFHAAVAENRASSSASVLTTSLWYDAFIFCTITYIIWALYRRRLHHILAWRAV